ncbi:MAG TPA: hypothetical protein VG818_01170 [Gemmatimonadaceae bacterium]|nr:hypothetical protein [Gemmatimonadaceae bacterium]
MLNRWAALALVLALCAFTPKYAAGQQAEQPRGRKAAGLGQNYPNPFNPETTIPFTIGDETCSDGGKLHVVSLRVYNVLAQIVAVPVLQGGTSSAGATSAAGQPLANLSLACGQYTAYWDGKYLNTGREVASGVYVYELVVDGQRLSRKMFVAK